MKLNTLLSTVLALLVAGLVTLPQTADARRMGSGGNVGKQYSTPAQTQTPPAAAQRPAATQSPAAGPGARAPQASGASRWLGPLAGLAAGGLLAAMLFGDGFEGFQIMDFLMIAALVFGGFMLFRMLRRGRATPLPAGAGAYARTAPGGTLRETGGMSAQGIRGGAAPSGSATPDQAPTWFNGAEFVVGAKSHYVNLQAAWDKGDFADLEEYLTPDMSAELKRDRARLSGPQFTEVVRLQAELVSVRRDGDQVVASVLFSGLIREDQQGAAQDFREIWHVQHGWASPDGNWYVAGIQQA
jgi:predicted lipid-binding transport protein (Tim44 family)